jgi:hypothetical protein
MGSGKPKKPHLSSEKGYWSTKKSIRYHLRTKEYKISILDPFKKNSPCT